MFSEKVLLLEIDIVADTKMGPGKCKGFFFHTDNCISFPESDISKVTSSAIRR